jgi:hypothetical protein
MEIPADHAAAVEERLEDILGYHQAKLSGAVPVNQQMRSLAFDAYTQGLLDGAQIKRDPRAVILGVSPWPPPK